MKFIQFSLRAFRAEWIKLRRSGIFWLIVGMSSFIPLVLTLIKVLVTDQPSTSETNAWEEFIQGCYTGFAGFFFPIFLILVASRLAQIEHRSAGWKLIETQPVHRGYLFLAKWEVAMFLSLICLLGVLAFGLIGGGIITLTGAGEPFKKSSIHLLPMLGFIARLWIASLGMLAIQYFLSIWVANFLFAFGIGLLALITASIISALNIAPWFPYSATIFTIRNPNGSQTGAFLLHHEWLSILWMLLFLWIGYQWYRYKSWKFAFLKPAFKPFLWLAVLLVFVAGFWWIEKPSQLNRYDRTVIAGTIKSTDTVYAVALLNTSTFDTLMVIPVQQNKFHFVTDQDLPLNEYLLATGPRYEPVIFSGKDSLHIEWKWDKQRTTAKIGGTRIAENEHYRSRSDDDLNEYFLRQYSQEFTPARYSSAVANSYKKAKRNLGKFRTVDNIRPGEDYLAIMDKLLALKYLKMLDIDYPKVFAVYNPNDSLKYPKSVDRFREKVPINDSTLVNFQEFRQFLPAYYHIKSTVPELKKDTAYFNYVIANSVPGKNRDMLLFEELKTVITYVRDSIKRNQFMSSYIPEIRDQKLQYLLLKANFRLNGLGRGKPAPDIHAVSLNNKNMDLKDLEGKFVVIDVWASWCLPCKKEAPYFEEFAEKYTSETVAFVSLSVDQDKNAWRIATQDKSKRVLQLWATNAGELNEYLGIEYIPRFMLIDPRGKIVNVQLPFPSDPEFEQIIQQETR